MQGPSGIKTKTVQSAELERERLTSLINSMADGVIAIDKKLDIVVSNGAALNILDVNATVTGKSVLEFLKLVDKNNQSIDIKKLITELKTPFTTRDWRVLYDKDDQINVYLSIAPVRLGFGQEGMHGYVILLRDITHEKSLEEERDEFISVVSHELRTPIAIAEGNIGNMEFLIEKEGIENKLLQEAVAQAHTQVTFLAGLINDLATLSRAERGKLQVEVESINVHELIDELDGFCFAPMSTLPFSVYLIEFVIKFCNTSRTSRANNGTGLGLYVTMKLARLIHAEISVESELNKGSTFSIFIPNLQSSELEVSQSSAGVS